MRLKFHTEAGHVRFNNNMSFFFFVLGTVLGALCCVEAFGRRVVPFLSPVVHGHVRVNRAVARAAVARAAVAARLANLNQNPKP